MSEACEVGLESMAMKERLRVIAMAEINQASSSYLKVLSRCNVAGPLQGPARHRWIKRHSSGLGKFLE